MNCLREILKKSPALYTSTSFLHSSLPPNVLRTGDVLKLSRTFSSSDVADYSKVSIDANPLYFNPESVKTAGFVDRLVPGMLVATLFPRITGSHFPGAVYASQTLQFKSPFYIGDEITGVVEATCVKEIKKRFVAKFSTKCFKNDGNTLVIHGEATAILPSIALDSHCS